MDLILVDAPTFERLRADGKETDLGGAPMVVPSIDHLLALKIHTLKQDQANRELKDLEDIVALIEAAEADISSGDFRDLCMKYGTEAIHDRIVRLAAGGR